MGHTSYHSGGARLPVGGGVGSLAKVAKRTVLLGAWTQVAFLLVDTPLFPFLIQPPGNRQAELPLMQCTQCAHRLACASPSLALPACGPLAFSPRNIGTYLLSIDMHQ